MATVQTLPEDIKHLICAELYSEHYSVDSRRRGSSLRSLSQISRAWNAQAEPFLYRDLRWFVASEEDSSRDARLLVEDKIASKYLKYAR